MNKAIFEIFRIGKHKKITWTEEDLKNIASSYNKNVKYAPLVIGHPENDAPELGKVERLIFCKGSLFAESEIDSALGKEIKFGRVNGISCAFYWINEEKNPIKGSGVYLRHVGFLTGKQKPVVKQMLPPEISIEGLAFSEEEARNIFLFSEDEDNASPEALHKKITYFQEVLNISYEDAFYLTMR